MEVLLVDQSIDGNPSNNRRYKIFSQRFIEAYIERFNVRAVHTDDLRSNKNSLDLFKELGPEVSSGSKGRLFIEIIPEVFIPFLELDGLYLLWDGYEMDDRGELFICSYDHSKEQIKINFPHIYSKVIDAFIAGPDEESPHFKQILTTMKSLEDKYAT